MEQCSPMDVHSHWHYDSVFAYQPVEVNLQSTGAGARLARGWLPHQWGLPETEIGWPNGARRFSYIRQIYTPLTYKRSEQSHPLALVPLISSVWCRISRPCDSTMQRAGICEKALPKLSSSRKHGDGAQTDRRGDSVTTAACRSSRRIPNIAV